MKLVEILGRELEQWPNTVLKMVQNISSKIEGYGESCGHINPATDCWNGRDYTGFYHESESLASDWRTAIITRADWEAERARIKGEKAMPKANKDGWIRHRGGKCSAPELSVVEVRLRNGTVLPAHDCERFTWEHSAVETDRQIMAYRVVDMREPVRYDYDYCDCDCNGPIQWRERIREIDAEQESEEAAHKAETERRDAERASLVSKLKAEGFVLIQSDEPNGEAESAQHDIAQQDMSDWRNWRPGDLVECVNGAGWSFFKEGHTYPVTDVVENDKNAEPGWCPIHLSNRVIGDFASDFKWHSRPTN